MITLKYYDGSVLTCYTIEDYGDSSYCDEYRIVPKCDIEEIVYTEEE